MEVERLLEENQQGLTEYIGKYKMILDCKKNGANEVTTYANMSENE